MEAAKHNCPACNTAIDSSSLFCPNCGKPINSNQAQTSAISCESLLEKACVYMHQDNYTYAQPLIEEALALAPQYADAYIIKLLCKLRLKNINDLGSIDTPLTSYEEFLLAMRYGSVYQTKRYEKLLANNAKLVEQKKQQLNAQRQLNILTLKNEISVLQKQIQQSEHYLTTHPIKSPLPKWRRILRGIELIFMICAVSFWTLGVLFVPQLIILDVPFLLRLIFIIIRIQKDKRLPLKIQNVANELSRNKTLLAEKTEQLDLFTKATS